MKHVGSTSCGRQCQITGKMWRPVGLLGTSRPPISPDVPLRSQGSILPPPDPFRTLMEARSLGTRTLLPLSPQLHAVTIEIQVLASSSLEECSFPLLICFPPFHFCFLSHIYTILWAGKDPRYIVASAPNLPKSHCNPIPNCHRR